MYEKDKKFDPLKLEEIKRKVLEAGFAMEIPYTTHVFKKERVEASIVVVPKEGHFALYCRITHNNAEKCNALIYKGKPSPLYFEYFFSKAKLIRNKVIVFGSNKDVEVHIDIENCRSEIVNKTLYDNNPLFEMFKTDLSPEEQRKADADWIDSLPPAVAAHVRRGGLN